MPQSKDIALKIAALLPQDRDKAEEVLGLVQDLLDWRGYSPEAAAACASSDRRSGSDDVSPQ
jgi:hypothetical protein